MDLMKIDIRLLNEKAQRFFEQSDGAALKTLFGSCKTLNEINSIAEELYSDFF